MEKRKGKKSGGLRTGRRRRRAGKKESERSTKE